MTEIYDVRHMWPEPAGFELERPCGYPSHTFMHFINPVDILVGGQMIKTQSHACILYRIDTPQKYHSSSAFSNDYIHFGMGLEDALVEYGIEFDTLYYPADPLALSSIVLEMQQIFFSESALKGHLLEVKLRELFIKLARNTHQAPLTNIDHTVRMKFLDLRIQLMTHLNHPWTVEMMAESLNISKSRFHTLYKDIFGCPPAADLIRIRIERAKCMLSLSREPISSIAVKLGYRSAAHFMRQFKAIVGISPGSYRESPSPRHLTGDSSLAVLSSIDVTTYHEKARSDHPEYRRIRFDTK